MSTKYEIGGHLIDARGVRHEIIRTFTDTQWVEVSGFNETVPADFFAYEPPARILSLQEAIEAAKAGETVEHTGVTARWCTSAEKIQPGLYWYEGGHRVEVIESYLTNWRIVPKAKPLPKMTRELADALVSAETVIDNIKFPVIERLSRAWAEAKGGAK